MKAENVKNAIRGILSVLFAFSPLFSTFLFGSGVEFDAGADLRIRQELFDNVPGCPGGGLVRRPYGKFTNHMRFRPRVWAELKYHEDGGPALRLYARLTDEFRWNVVPHKNITAWPGELIPDNFFVEGKGLFDGLLDFKIGRQDLWGYCKLDHVFFDGTPGDGSRSLYTDMASIGINIDERNRLDLFGLYDFDNADDLRWGRDHQRYPSLAARFPDGTGDQDDWGYGAIWTCRQASECPWQFFAMQKRIRRTEGVRNHTELVGAKVMPRWSDELSSTFEVMNELNSEWSGFADIEWKSSRDGVKPFCSLGYHFLSKEWDPMWSRAVIYSELFVYGTHNGVAWWSNMHFLKATAGLEFSKAHSLSFTTGPIFAAEADGVGGGDGCFKGELSQLYYRFPILLADHAKGERFEVIGHVMFEYFNPGDYYESDRSAWFARWQVEFRF